MLKNMDPKQRKITISVVSTVGVIISYLVLAYFISWWPFGGTNANDIFKGIEAYKVDVEKFNKAYTDAKDDTQKQETAIKDAAKLIKETFIDKVATFTENDNSKPGDEAKKTNFANAQKALKEIKEEHKKLDTERKKAEVDKILSNINNKVAEFKTEFKTAFGIN